MPRTENETKPRQFRLSKETLNDLDLIADWLALETRRLPNRTDAVRYAARETAKKIQKKTKRGIDSVATDE